MGGKNSGARAKNGDPTRARVIAATIAEQKAAFILAFAATGTIREASERVGIDRNRHAQWVKDDPDYAEAFASAAEDRADLLEQEAYRRAHDGTDEPVYWQGMLVGQVRKYSDTLMLALLKAARPEKFKERQEVVTRGALNVRFRNMREDEIDAEYEANQRELTAAAARAAAKTGSVKPS